MTAQRSQWQRFLAVDEAARSPRRIRWTIGSPSSRMARSSSSAAKWNWGTGVKTALAQIVAEELDVPFERIQMVMGDTALTPDEGYTAGSTRFESGGLRAAPRQRRGAPALLELASDRLDAAIDELTVRDGTVISVTYHPDRDDHLRRAGWAAGNSSADHRDGAAQTAGRVSHRRPADPARRPAPQSQRRAELRPGRARARHAPCPGRAPTESRRQVSCRSTQIRCEMPRSCVWAISSASWPSARRRPCARRRS